MEIAELVIIAIAAFLCLSMGIIFFVVLYQRRIINHQLQLREFNRQKEMELMQASIRSEEEERMRIATELHDDVGATLASVRLFLHQAIRDPGNEVVVTQTKDLLDESIRKVRDLSHQLQPGVLQYLGLVKTLQSLAEITSRTDTVAMETVQETALWPEPDAPTALALYRITQELINNTIKHARASQIRLTITTHAGRYCLMMTHNGHGLTEADYREQLYKQQAIGLKNIERRLKSANLSIIFMMGEDRTFTIILCLPGATD